MKQNDFIQGIVFDVKPKITFVDPPKHKISRIALDLKNQLIKTKKSYIQKRYKPTYKTDLMPDNAAHKTTKSTKTISKRVILR